MGARREIGEIMLKVRSKILVFFSPHFSYIDGSCPHDVSLSPSLGRTSTKVRYLEIKNKGVFK